MGFNYVLAQEIITFINSDNIEENIKTLVYIEHLATEDFINKVFEIGKNNIVKPCKYSLLHCFCEKYLYYYLLHEKCYLLDLINGELNIEFIMDCIEPIKKILEEYQISNQKHIKIIMDFDKKYEESDFELDKEYQECIQNVFNNMFQQINNKKKKIIEDTYYLLFDNKDFLFKFNNFLSNFITTEYLPAYFFDNHKHIKRCSSFPKWLKDAVYTRAKGHCEGCGIDLSGVISRKSYRETHYDHVVALKQGGTNDATNIQLLCHDCNSKRSGKKVVPEYFYQTPW